MTVTCSGEEIFFQMSSVPNVKHVSTRGKVSQKKNLARINFKSWQQKHYHLLKIRWIFKPITYLIGLAHICYSCFWKDFHSTTFETRQKEVKYTLHVKFCGNSILYSKPHHGKKLCCQCTVNKDFKPGFFQSSLVPPLCLEGIEKLRHC